MNRREILGAGAAGMAMTMNATTAKADGHGKTGFVLVHGSWHGSWCWRLVAEGLSKAGYLNVSVDLPGSGLNARPPKSYFQRPLDGAAFATEVSHFASIENDEYADAVLAGAAELKAQGADKVVAVGHSMGGMPITLAAAKDPSAIQGLVFATAVTATPGKPAGAYLGPPAPGPDGTPRQIVLADPGQVGALRIDPRSIDPDYNATAKAALAADVPDDLWAAALDLMTPDAPAKFYGDVIEFPEAYAAVERTFVRCTKDEVLLPAYQDAMIADMNAAWPDSPVQVIEMESSHELMFSKPDEVVQALMNAA